MTVTVTVQGIGTTQTETVADGSTVNIVFSTVAPPTGVTFVGQSTAGVTTGNFVLNLPSGVQNGDFLITAIGVEQTGAMSLSGWTSVGSVSNPNGAESLQVFTKYASSEPSSYNWGAIPYPTGVIRAYRHAASSSAIGSSSSIASSGATSLTIPGTSETPVTGELVVSFFTADGYDTTLSNLTGPSGWSNVATFAGYPRNFWSGDKSLGSSVPAVTATISPSNVCDGFMLTVHP